MEAVFPRRIALAVAVTHLIPYTSEREGQHSVLTGSVACMGGKHRRGAALSRYREATKRVLPLDPPDLQTWVRLRDGYGCPDACESAADYQDVVAGWVHVRLIIFSGEN